MSNPEGLAIARRLIAEEAEKKTGSLDLGMLGLTELPDALFALTHLRTLNLGSWFHAAKGVFQESNNSLIGNEFSNSVLSLLSETF